MKTYTKLEKIVCIGQVPGREVNECCKHCYEDESNKLCPTYKPVDFTRLRLRNYVKPYKRR